MDHGGIALARTFYGQLVAPAVAQRWPDLPLVAGRLGTGSDVLGLDDAMSRDHDWGLRMNLLVPPELATQVDDHLTNVLPDRFAGHPVRFATTWDPRVRHRVEVEDVRSFVLSRTRLDMERSWSATDWLSLTGQAVLEVTAGSVFQDSTGELSAVRRRLTWYPDDLWMHVVATDWARIAQELPFVGRTAECGDDLGSRVITARLINVAMHLAHLLERCWPPYAKWLGTSLTRLPRARAVAPALEGAARADDWTDRESGLVEAVRMLHELQREVGLPGVADPVEPFWDRLFRAIRDEVVAVLEARIADAEVRGLPRGVGSAEQWSHNVDVLVHSARRPPR